MKTEKKKLIESLEKTYNNFLNWFNKFSDWAISDIWLINEVYFKENEEKSKFFWDSPNYEFGFEIRDYDDNDDEVIILKIVIYRPIDVSFIIYISKEEANQLIEKAKKITKFYKDNEKEVVKIKKNVLLKILNSSDEYKQDFLGGKE